MTRPEIEVVALDADDTLWHSEIYYARTERLFRDIVGRYVSDDVDVDAALYEVDARNLHHYGYGVKGFILSMIEAAIEITDGELGTAEIDQLLAAGRSMLHHPVDLIDGAIDAITALDAAGHRLLLVTKGDLHHQERKIAESGLSEHFERMEIVAEKDAPTYRRVVESMGVDPAAFCMVGNSVRSDVLPVLEIGGHAVHIPYHVTWAHEIAEHDGSVPTLDSISDLPAWLATSAGRLNGS